MFRSIKIKIARIKTDLNLPNQIDLKLIFINQFL